MEKLAVINGLRGAAIIGVIYHHVFYRHTFAGFGSFEVFGVEVLPFTYLSNGWLGVNLFFLLSGFVLAYPFFLGKRQMLSSADFRSFYRRRAGRLLPLYYFFLVISITLLAKPVAIEVLVKELMIMGTATFNFTKHMWFPRFNFAFWSIGIEIWFSILFPFILVLIRKYDIYRVLVGVLILSLSVRIFANAEVLYLPPDTALLDPVRDSLLGRLDDFMWGIFLCHMYVTRPQYILKAHKSFLFISGFISATVACLLWDYVSLGLISTQVVPFINLVLDVGFSLILASLLFAEESIFVRLFSNYFLQILGLMCYSLYVWHVPSMRIITNYDVTHVISYILALFILSCLSYRYIEFGREENARSLFLMNGARS